MTNKTLYLLVFFISMASLSGCQKKELYSVYVQPELVGTIYNRQSEQPIPGVEIFRSSKHSVYTDETGYFNSPAYKYEYYSYDNQLALLLSGGATSLRKPGYADKVYSATSLPRPQSRSGQKEFVDMGKIYMTPVPLGQEHAFSEDITGMTYCKPQQSQKEVDCVPVPKGYKYEDLTNIAL